jgi:3-deoxy-manno-octulosonate cytidylyltransferase (CMP-KDO synthetase)
MKKVIVIPARYASTRLPGKPLREILGKSLIRRVYESALTSRMKDAVMIATDDVRIVEEAASFGARAIMTSAGCRSGTDRVYEAVRDLGAGIVVNVQGDEPEIRGDMIDAIFQSMETEEVEMATLCTPIAGEEEYGDPNCVKVVRDKAGFALYFSRSPIPFLRNRGAASPVFKHIGIYGFTMFSLQRFVSMEKSRLEETESLEQLRVLENGHRIKVLTTEYDGFGIDTEEDVARFVTKLQAGQDLPA